MKPRLLLLLVNLALLAAWLGQVPPALLARRELGTPRLHSGAYAPRCGTDRAVVPAPRAAAAGRAETPTATSTEPGGGSTLEELWRAPGDDVAVIPGTAEPRARRRPRLVPRRRRRGAGRHASDGARLGRRTRSTRRRSSRPRRSSSGSAFPAAPRPTRRTSTSPTLRLPRAGQVLDARRAGGRQRRRCRRSGTSSWRRRTHRPTSATPQSRRRRRRSRRRAATPRSSRRARRPTSRCCSYSVADSLAAKVPFVVTFATPKFCSSRTCGPVVDVVEEVQRRLEGDDVRFIHVEVYEDNDPAKGFNQWMREWKLPTEPWTFLVDGEREDRGSLRGNGLGERARDRRAGEAGPRVSVGVAERARPRCSARGPSG